MAKCSFDVPFTGSASDLVVKLREKVEGADGTFNGDTSSGNYLVPTPLGKIEGTYKINAQIISVVITKKPIVISCHAIETFVQKEIEQ